jgi:hypothetical protein
MMVASKKSKTPAKPKDKGAGVLFVRDDELAADIDAWVLRLNGENPDGPQWNRAALVRAALKRALRERGEKGQMP